MKKFLLAVMAIAITLGATTTGASAATTFVRAGSFAVQQVDGDAVHHRRIAVNYDTGDIYIADQQHDRVSVYRPDGDGAVPLTEFGTGQLTDPYGIAIDQDSGTVYVSDADGVTKYDSDGAPTPTFTADSGFASLPVTGPLAFDQTADQLLVADAVADVVRRYSAAGAPVSNFDGSAGIGSPGAFDELQDLAVDSTGDIVVIDADGDPGAGATSRIGRFDGSGDWEAAIGPVDQAATVGIAPETNNVVVGGNQDSVDLNELPTLEQFAPDGTDLGAVRVDDSLMYSTTAGIALDDGATGRLYVATDVSAGSYPGQYGVASVQAYEVLTLRVLSTLAVPTFTEAKLRAQINPNGEVTTYRFEYGPTDSYGKSTVAQTVPAGVDPVGVTANVTGLTPGAEYHFRVVIANSQGTVQSADRAFNTLLRPPPDTCPNAEVRRQQGAERLEDCRAWEQVSPVEKFGTDAPVAGPGQIPVVASDPDGDNFVFKTNGGFADATQNLPLVYRSTRAPGGWDTRAMTPAIPAGTRLNLSSAPQVSGFSEDTSRLTFDQGQTAGLAPGAPSGVDTGGGNAVYLRDTSLPELIWLARPTLSSPVPGPHVYAVGASRDMSRVVIQVNPEDRANETTKLVAEDADRVVGSGLYEWVGGELRAVGVLPNNSIPETGASAPSEAFGSPFPAITPGAFNNQVSADGRRILFVARESSGDPNQLYVRVKGTSTELVSKSQIDGQPSASGATFAYASPDGSTVWFSSDSQLTSDAPVGGTSIYRYDAGSGDVTYEPTGAGPLVSSTDGARYLYQPGGTEELWLADGTDRTKVADNAPIDTYYKDIRATGDGSRFVFMTAGAVPGFSNGGGFKQVYVYDTDADELSCASCSPAGDVATDDARLSSGYAQGAAWQTNRSITSDGASVYFSTPLALDPRDVNTKRDVYEWRDGAVRLLSSGRSSWDSLILDNSADGKSVFIATRDQLSSTDEDSNFDVYDVRAGGGFAQGSAPPACDGDCLPSASTPPDQPAVGSETSTSSDNPPAPPRGSVSVARPKAVTGSRTSLRIRTSGRGRLTATGSGLKTSRMSVSKAGYHRLSISLTSSAKSRLAKKRTLNARVKVVFTPPRGAASATTVTVTFKATKKKGR